MRVLVTRPEPDGARTAARLAEAGHDPVLLPLFGTRMTASPRDLPPAGRIGGLVATSARALALFEAGDLLDKSLFDVPLHAVGPATARAAQRVGFRTVNEAAGTASDLARTLVAHLAGPKRRAGLDGAEDGAPEFIYLAGVPRTPVIEQALEQAGVAFSVVECYEMIEISYSTDILVSEILSPPPAAVLLYSANAARRLAALDQGEGLGKRLDSARFLCLSETIAAELPGAWRARAVAAHHPDEDSLLASLAALG